MDNQEAKFILSAYRPGGEDAAGSQFAEALKQVSRDPGLAQWFAEQRLFDQANSDALCSIPLPADLRGNILAGVKISQRRFWPMRPALLAMAAGIMLFAVAAGMWTRYSGLDAWQKGALAFIPTIEAGQTQFDHEASDARVLQQWLVAQHSPFLDAMPAGLQALPALGCKTFSLAGRPASITCFRLRGDALVHLVVTDASHLNHAPPSQPRFVKHDGWMTASWTENSHACMLATKASSRELQDLFGAVDQVSPARLAVMTEI